MNLLFYHKKKAGEGGQSLVSKGQRGGPKVIKGGEARPAHVQPRGCDEELGSIEV